MFTAVNSKGAFANSQLVAEVHSCELLRSCFLWRLQPGSFCEVHPEAITSSLIPTSHFRRGMPKLFLDIALINVSAARQTSSQRMTREQGKAFFLRQVGSNPRVSDCLLDQARNMFVRQAISCDLMIVTRDALEQWPKVDLGVVQILLKGVNRAGLVTGASANLNFAPSGFAAKRQDQSALLNGNPAFTVICVVSADVETYDLRAAETPGVSNQQDSTVTLITQTKRKRCDHVQDVFGQHCFFLHRRARVYALDAGQNSGNVAILTIESKAALLVMPAKAGETLLYGADGQGRAGAPSSGEAQLAM